MWCTGDWEMKKNGEEAVRLQVKDKIEEREHFHQDIELIFVLEGELDILIGEQKTHMEQEDILVINANKKHYMRSSVNTLYAQLMIDYHTVSEGLQSMNVIYWCDSTKDESDRYNELRRILKVLLNHQFAKTRSGTDFGHIALCYRVIEMLSMYFLVQTADKETIDDEDRFEERIQQINNYIRANYNQQISLKDLADKLYLSNGYLSRFFKRNYGMSFAEYLTNIRLFHAVDELLYTNTPITRIAYDNGFASVAVFNKSFKKAYDETPSALRRKMREQKETEPVHEHSEEIEKRLEQYLLANQTEEEMQKGTVCEGVHSVNATEELRSCWSNLINIGAASDLLRSELREHVILLKEALGFQYVRFWNIFSKDMLIDAEQEEGEYNFARLDSILDFLLQHGLKPHLEMGMKPKVIVYNVQKMYMEGTRNVEFLDKTRWQRLVNAMMRHLVHRYGLAEVDTWRLELWFNENKWDEPGSYEEYLGLFKILYQTAKKYSEKIEVGGCGVRLDYQEEMRREFYQKWRTEGCRPDFLSIIYYYYDRGEEKQDIYAKRSSDNECMKHRICYEKRLLKEMELDDIPVYITEWNLTASARNYINDSCFKGAYIIKNLLDLYGIAEDTGYFIGSDRFSEHYDSRELLYGGTGLMARDGILKPAGFAFEFMRRLYPYYVGKGEQYLISTDRHNSYGIVCHNQRALGYHYYYTREDQVEKEHLWKYFEDRDALDIQLELKDAVPGTYQVKCYRINEKNGNVLNIWKEMDYEKELSRNDIKYFRRMCEPKLTIQKAEVKDGTLKLNIPMEANEIAFIRVRLFA